MPSAARGQPADPQRDAAAQALYQQAIDEMSANQYASACRKLEEVTRLVPEGVGAKLTLAQCYEDQGRLASAWAQYALVAEVAAKAGQGDRARRATAKVNELGPKLATLAVEVPDEVRALPGLTVERDGLSLGEGQWGTPIPVDAGPHEVIATAPGRKAWKQRAEVAANGAQVVVRVGPLKVNATPPSERPWQRPVGIGAMGLGGVGVVVGAVLGGLAISKNGESNDGHCNAENRCDPEGIELRKAALSRATASTTLIAVGGVLLVGGVVLFATAPRAKDETLAGVNGGWWSARMEVGLGSVQVKGEW